MGDFGIFNGKNDLAKFLSIGGIFLIIFTILYPVEKKQDLDLLIVKNNSEIRVLNSLLDQSNSRLDDLIKRTNEINASLSNLSDSKKVSSLIKERKSIGVENDKIIEDITKKELDIENIKDKLTVNRHYSDKYGSYLGVLSFVGWVMLAVGLVGWFMSAHKEWKKP